MMRKNQSRKAEKDHAFANVRKQLFVRKIKDDNTDSEKKSSTFSW